MAARAVLAGKADPCAGAAARCERSWSPRPDAARRFRPRLARVHPERARRVRRRRSLEAPILQDGIKGKAFFFDDNNRGVLGDGVGDYERTQPFSIDLWVLADQIYDDATVFNHREDNNTGNAGYQLQLDKNRLQFDLSTRAPAT